MAWDEADETIVDDPVLVDTSGKTGDTARGALQAGDSSSYLRGRILRGNGVCEPDDVGDRVHWIWLCVAAHLAKHDQVKN